MPQSSSPPDVVRAPPVSDDKPKQYVEIGGKAVLTRSIEAFLTHERMDLVQPVIHPDDRALYEAATVGAALAETASSPSRAGTTGSNRCWRDWRRSQARSPDPTC